MFRNFLQALPQYLLPKVALTAFANLMANLKIPFIKNYLIKDFVSKHPVQMQDAIEENPLNYVSFNDFFIRQLKPEKRPLAASKLLCPVDGVISEFGRIEKGKLLQAKGQYFEVSDFLASKPLSEPFIDGYFATFYLAPKDYHRVHMPLDAQVEEMIYVPGKLFSVRPETARIIPNLFARNERLVVLFESHLGPVTMVLVGAAIVGCIGTQWQGDLKRSKTLQHTCYEGKEPHLKQGDEMGYFKLGSTVVLLLTKDADIKWVDAIKPGASVKYGEALAIV